MCSARYIVAHCSGRGRLSAFRLLTPGSSIGRYVVQRKLAEGGMAEIYLCTMVGPGGFAKDVVLKVVKSFLANDSTFIGMFIDEARLASRLNHVNVVQLFDFGQHDDRYFIAMEYVRGGTLSELRKRCAAASVPFPPTLAADICAKVARGLHHAHTLTERGKPVGLVHRDVTPQNILLAFDGAVKLTDFGIAKANSSATAPGMLKGKYAYMAPEQARGEPVDVRTDVFALGITLWELLTGARLFEGSSDIAVLRAVQETVIASPSRLNPEVAPALSNIVLKALTREPKGRYQTAAELEEALSQFVVTNTRALEDTRVDLFMRPLYPEESDDRPAQPTGSIALADTLKGGRKALGEAVGDETVRPTRDAAVAPTLPSRTALTASSSPTDSMQGLQPADGKTPQKPGQRQSVPRLKTSLPSLATPAGREVTEQDESGSVETMNEKPGVATAPMRRSMKVTPVATGPQPEEDDAPSKPTRDDRKSLPRFQPVSEENPLPDEIETASQVQAHPTSRRWIGALVGLAGVAALGLAAMVIKAQRGSAAAAEPPEAIVEVKAATPAPAPTPQVPVLEPEPVGPEPAAAVAVAAAEPKVEPPPAEPAAKPAPTVGFLEVHADPWAYVIVDGQQLEDVEGVKKFPLKPGKHTVVLKNKQHALEPQSVQIRAGKPTRVDFKFPK